ncbi:MAG: TraC family protein [Patescibacteria group bacterium]
MKSKAKKTSTQKYLPFKTIKEGVVTLQDGSTIAVLMVNSINFNLKSNDEQVALLGNFKGFLNSLETPIQILIQSRILDLDTYLKDLERLGTNQTNELLQAHTKEYIEFVRELISMTNIMSKTFYLIISDKNLAAANPSLLAQWFGRSTSTSGGQSRDAHSQLLTAANLIAGNLTSMQLNCVLLNTKELIDLLYATYNPDLARRQKLFNVNSVDASIIAGLAKENRG